jgi:glycosyltransferase involved in cell wall biosynthesis
MSDLSGRAEGKGLPGAQAKARSEMRLSIIVLTHNRLAALRECLIRIGVNTSEKDAEIIVVDNGSTDATAIWLELQLRGEPSPPGIHPEAVTGQLAGFRPMTAILRPTNEGVCARNYAIDIARGEIIAQVDDDVLVTPEWDEVLLSPFDDPAVGATGQHGFYQEQSWERTPWSAGLIDDRRRPVPGQFCDFVMGFAWGWRSHKPDGSLMFRYDERFNPRWHEESDGQLVIRAASYKIMCTREIATHLSLPHCHTREESIPMAQAHFELLRSKWQNDKRIRYEGKAVGL